MKDPKSRLFIVGGITIFIISLLISAWRIYDYSNIDQEFSSEKYSNYQWFHPNSMLVKEKNDLVEISQANFISAEAENEDDLTFDVALSTGDEKIITFSTTQIDSETIINFADGTGALRVILEDEFKNIIRNNDAVFISVRYSFDSSYENPESIEYILLGNYELL